MKTLKIKTTDKNQAIKEINKFRLLNKNEWYQIELIYNPYTHKMKCYDTWVQLNYVYKDNVLLYNDSSNMDMNVKEFKEFLNCTIEYKRVK